MRRFSCRGSQGKYLSRLKQREIGHAWYGLAARVRLRGFFYFYKSDWGRGGAVVWKPRLGVGWGEQEGSVRLESGGER